ncbi:MAG: VCBS repeat-containing protein [Opitutaceae bacterium]|nr:VCBS repeat-containing protein [Opitutaceae bacterium]
MKLRLSLAWVTTLGVHLAFALPGAAADARPRPASFHHTVIDDAGPASIWGKGAADLNADGRVDLLAGGWRGGGLVWYENPGWIKHVIDFAGKFGTDLEVVDLNRDGKPDIIAIAGDGIAWYEAPDWKPHHVAKDAVHDIEVADFDRDGDIDIVARNQNLSRGKSGATLFIYRQESLDTWTRATETISDGEGLAAADLDRDGDLDVVINGTWLENRGDLLGRWPVRVFGPEWKQDKVFVATGDLNGDGRLDIALSPSEPKGQRYRISWFEAPANAKSGRWIEHVVEPDIETVQHFVGIADFNLDGRPDIVAAAMLQGDAPQNVSVYLNHGGGKRWTKQVIGTNGNHSMRIVDLDGNGAPSLFGANHQSNKVELWRNITPPGKPPGPGR